MEKALFFFVNGCSEFTNWATVENQARDKRPCIKHAHHKTYRPITFEYKISATKSNHKHLKRTSCFHLRRVTIALALWVNRHHINIIGPIQRRASNENVNADLV